MIRSSQPPEFDLFPASPFNVLVTNRMVLHVELSSTTERITILWHHGDTTHSNFIFEDPYCVETVEVSSLSLPVCMTLISPSYTRNFKTHLP